MTKSVNHSLLVLTMSHPLIPATKSKTYSGTRCMVPGCNNSYQNVPTGIKRSFFQFPITKRASWIASIGLPADFIPGRQNRVCSDHFLTKKYHKDPLHPDFNPCLLPETTPLQHDALASQLQEYLKVC